MLFLWLIATIALAYASSQNFQLSTSARSEIASFKVMDVLQAANEKEAKGAKVFHMEVGQPGTGAPDKVLKAATKAVRDHLIGYTSTQGILPLREAIAQNYKTKYGVDIQASRVVITTGSSAAFVFTFMGNRSFLLILTYPLEFFSRHTFGFCFPSIRLFRRRRSCSHCISRISML